MYLIVGIAMSKISHMNFEVATLLQVTLNVCTYRGGGTGPADPAAAGPIIYSEITTKDDLTT